MHVIEHNTDEIISNNDWQKNYKIISFNIYIKNVWEKYNEININIMER